MSDENESNNGELEKEDSSLGGNLKHYSEKVRAIRENMYKPVEIPHENSLDALPSFEEMHPHAVKQTEALTQIGTALATISNWVTQGGLTEIMTGYAKSNAVKEILGGLAAHDGRNALDARVLSQNALEIVHQVEGVFDKFAEHLKAKKAGELDPDLHNAEADFIKFKEKENAGKTDSSN